MQIRKATIEDAESIKNVYLQAFAKSEDETIFVLALNLLKEDDHAEVISLVAIADNIIVGHVAFSPVLIEANNKHIGYILSPLAVSSAYQKNRIGSSLVQYGLDVISGKGSFIVFVYGDPKYYSRFDFERDLAKSFMPPYDLDFPEGWLAMKIHHADFSEGGTLKCVDALNDPVLW